MKKSFLFLLFIAITLHLTAQDGYIVKLDLSLSNNCCDACNEFSVNSIVVKNKNTGEIYWGGNWAFRSGFSKSMWISCNVGDVISVSGSGIKTESYEFDVAVAKGAVRTGSYKSSDNGIFWHNSTVSVSTYGYAVPRITSFSGNLNNCVSNEYSSIYTFNLETSNTVIQSALEAKNYNLLIEVANNRNFTNSRTFYINDKSTSYTCSYRTIASTNASDWYGDDLYFRTKIQYSNPVEIYTSSNVFGPRRFYSQMPSIVGITEERTACSGDVITMNLGSQGMALVNNYEFRAVKKSYVDSGFGNVIKLKKGTTSGNYIDLTVDPTSVYEFENASEEYVFQVINTQYNTCATTRNETIIEKPSYLSITATPEEKATFNDTSYHILTYGGEDGEITLQVAGGSASRISKFEHVQYRSWRTIPASQLTQVNATTWKYTGLEASEKTYVRVVDTDGCMSSPDFPELREPSELIIHELTATLVTCHVNNADDGSTSDGIIRVSFSGGIGNYIAELYNNNDSLLETVVVDEQDNYFAQFSPQGVGNYTIRITDRFDEYTEQYVEVTSNPEIILSAIPSDVACYNDGSGSIELQVSNNKVPGGVSFDLNGNTTPFISDTSYTYPYLEPGVYSAQVTNSNGCKAALSDIGVTQPGPIETEITPYKIRRYGGNTGVILFKIQGGTAPYTYRLYHGDTLIDSYPTSDYGVVLDLYAGYYRLEVVDAHGCEYTEDDIYVQQPDAPLELSFVKPLLPADCYGAATGEVYPIASGGWGGYRYGINDSIVGSDNIISGLRASGDVPDTVFVRDTFGMTQKLPVTITQPSEIRSSVDSIYNLRCFEDSSGVVSLSISGGTPGYRVSADTINWLSGDSLPRLSAGADQIVYIKDAHNCVETEVVTITQPEKVIVAVDTVIDAFCGQHNGTISTSVTGGSDVYSYQWNYVDSLQSFSVDSQAINNIYSGKYQLHVADENACADSIMVLVSDEDGPEITGYRIDSVSCFGNSDGKLSILQISGGMPGYTYYLNGQLGNIIFSGLAPDTYHVRVMDAKGCKFDTVYTVSQPDKLVLSGTVSQPLCHDSFDGTITTHVTGGNGGYTYNWSHREETPNVYELNAGSFSVEVTDMKGCALSDSFNIIPPDVPSAHLDAYHSILCIGNSMELDGGNFADYQWFYNDVPVSRNRHLTVDKTGEYVLMIHDELGCVGLDTFNLEVSDTPLDAHILLQDSALVNETVEAIDVTWPIPDSVQWYFDYPVEQLEANTWSQQFSDDTASTINVTLRAWYGGCFSDSSKTVTIYYADDSVMEKAAHKEPLIIGFKAYPNPNFGDFFVDVQLSKRTAVTLRIFYAGTSDVITTKKQFGKARYEIPFNFINLPAGVYIIVLMVEQERQQLKVMVK
jgi:hypothetical protein